MTSRVPLLAAVAAVLTATGELEVLLASAPDSERLVSALALPLLTVRWRGAGGRRWRCRRC